MSALKDIKLSLRGGDVAAQERKPSSGEPSRRILLLHGWQDNSNSYSKLIPLLPADWWLVAIDWPGHGLSSQRAPGSPYYLTDWLTDVRQVTQKLGWKKYDIIGHSMGAGVASMYAALFPEEVEAVVLLDVVKQMSEPPGAIHKTLRNAVTMLADYNAQEENKTESFTRDGAVDWWYERNKQFMNKDSAQILMDRGLKRSEAGKFEISRDHRLVLPPLFRMTLDQHRSILKELKCDVLIIKAPRGPQSWEAEEIEKEFLDLYSKNSSKFKLENVEGLHHVHLDNAEAVAPLIVDFLKRH